MFDNLKRKLGLMPSSEESEKEAELFLTESQLLDVEDELAELKQKAYSGVACVEAVLKRGIEYYDPSKLPYADQVQYKANAKLILNNEVFQNELRTIEADLVEHIAKTSKTFEEVMQLRMTINALELLRSRLEGIPDPRAQEVFDEERAHDSI